MDHCSQRIGEAYFRTPRNTIKSFVHLLSVIEQNPGTDWKTLLGGVEVARDDGARLDSAPAEGGSDNDLVNLKL